MSEITTPELQEIDFKIKILDMILQEARANGDERWHEPARQIEELNKQRAAILKAERKKRGIELQNVVIQTKLARMGAKTHG